MIRLLVTICGVGHIKPASGTWGSLAALPLFYVIFSISGLFGIILSLIAILLLGWFGIERYSQETESHDASEIVIDEVFGQFIALLPVAIGAVQTGVPITALYPGWIAAFILFRVFDVLKPGPIGTIDKKGTALSVMLDDALAGVFAALGVLLLAGVAHGFA